MSSINYVQDATGNTYIPPTQRPDGTWRRPIRVREGYVPQDEQPAYVSKFKHEKTSLPVGLSLPHMEIHDQKVSASGNFNIGNLGNSGGIPGLNFISLSDGNETQNKKKKKNKTKDTLDESKVKESVPATVETKVCSPTTNIGTSVDPSKRLRNLKKRLRDIESLEERVNQGKINPDKDQLEKLQRKNEVLDEISQLSNMLQSTGIKD